MEKINLTYSKKKMQIYVVHCGYFKKILGLMFRSKNTNALLFDFKKPTKLKIHSLFVFFPFVAVWLNKNGKIIEIKKVKPFAFTVRCKRSFTKLVEIPYNDKYSKVIKQLFPKNT